MAASQTPSSPQAAPLVPREPFLTKRRAFSIVGLIIFLGFFAIPIYQTILLEMWDSPRQLTQQIVIGLTKGTYIAVIALGYTLVYGILELINFAHGDLFMIGAFLALIFISLFGLDPKTSSGITIFFSLIGILGLVMVCTALMNAGIERFAYRPLRNAPRLAPLISAIGMSFVLQNVGIFLGDGLIWDKLAAGLGSDAIGRVADAMGTQSVAPKNIPDLLPNGQVFFIPDSLKYTYKDLLVAVVSLGLLAGLYSFVRFTKLGKAIRATAQDRDAARLMGINADRTISVTFLIGGALGGAAGMIVGLYNGTALFSMGFTAGLLSFTAAVLGGIGNILGSALGGLLIGLILALSDQYIGTRWSNAVIFAILVLILLFRPTGLLGQEGGQKA
ncbi:branched-chain amino acid ABC transporter permease [Herpetosiphon llansteffanensis]|uniref:branched-chain amino acid ABC transporter permease n=1 Tax=Herpetosiphon llansteffanensis TaxID=2094568 RepID=UPI001F0B7E5A|nr:branched-chain amino acid ABC transporter permease [Herpetosiphon llansteffanensis]